MAIEHCVLIFVIETDPIAMTDERYIKKFLQVHYNNLYNNLIKPYFIYTTGKSKYNDSIVEKTVNDTVATIPFKDTTIYKVIYCFDRDRINKDKMKMSEIINYVKKKNGQLVLFSKDIESCFNPKWCGGKVETAKRFYQNASKADMPLNIFEKSIEICMKSNKCSNLNLVVKNLINKINI